MQLCDKDVVRRVWLAAVIVRNPAKLWKAKNISKTNNLEDTTMVEGSISFNLQCGTWTLKEEHKTKLCVFEISV